LKAEIALTKAAKGKLTRYQAAGQLNNLIDDSMADLHSKFETQLQKPPARPAPMDYNTMLEKYNEDSSKSASNEDLPLEEPKAVEIEVKEDTEEIQEKEVKPEKEKVYVDSAVQYTHYNNFPYVDEKPDHKEIGLQATLGDESSKLSRTNKKEHYKSG